MCRCDCVLFFPDGLNSSPSINFPSLLCLSCRLEHKILPLRLSGLSVFDMNKVTTCITLLATEACRMKKNKPSVPGDSSRDLFIPKRWRSRFAFQGGHVNSPSLKGHQQNCQVHHIFQDIFERSFPKSRR